MRITSIVSVLAASALASPLRARITADSVKFILAFGDSYSSDGWAGTTDPLVKHGTTCSAAGPVWTRQLAALLPGTPKLVNLAVAGSTADNTIVSTTKLDFVGQVDAFYNYVIPNVTLVPWTPEDTLFTVGFGTNDISLSYNAAATDQPNGNVLHAQDLDSYFASVERLYLAGARAFVFNGIAPLDRSQLGLVLSPELQAQLRTHIDDFLAQLEGRVDAFCASKTDLTTCFFYDLHTLVSDIMDAPGSYGFVTSDAVCPTYASRTSCTVSASVDASCLGGIDSYVWRDGLHPAYRVHSYWATDITALLV